MTAIQRDRRVLVIGATGYVGTRLVQQLLDQDFIVRAASRSIEKMRERSWAKHNNVELCALDIQNEDDAETALKDCAYVFYLVHSMNPQNKDFAEADRAAAQVMVRAGEKAGIDQLIYLGGLGETNTNLSKHLQSRAEVGDILKTAKYPTTILRAAMIIGSGSASFEILRYLVERLPVMITPKWVNTPSQPIAIRNVLYYLVACLANKNTYNQTFDIGGTEIVTYRELMKIYARQAGLPAPFIVPVPVFTPKLSSYWINFITPVPAFIARPLADGLRNPAVCMESRIRELIPQELLSCEKAMQLAIDKIQHHQVESHWTDAGKLPPVEWFNKSDPNWSGGTVFSDIRTITIDGGAKDAWHAISRIGGSTGWYYANWLWILRGFFDQLFGGTGLRRGRRHPDQIGTGDAIDFWRAKAVEPDRRLLLIAEMRLPGQAALEFQIIPQGDNKTQIIQIARFLPSGLLGLAYWFAVTPFHEFIFSGMLRGLAKASNCKMDGGVHRLPSSTLLNSPT